jgi:surface protein
MPNAIKYNVSAETLALKKGNFYIGTGDVGKGPTSSTGYYNGITPPSGGYTIYLNKASGGPSIYVVNNDTELISLTNTIAGQTFTSTTQCLVYYRGQTDKVCFNRDYEPIVTDGLVLNVDAGFDGSYPESGTTWSDLSLSGNNGTLINSPSYYANGGGSIVFDGVDDNIDCGTSKITGNNPFSWGCWINPNTSPGTPLFMGLNSTGFGMVSYWDSAVGNKKVRVGTWFGDKLTASTVIPDNTWAYTFWTWDGTTLNSYTNGINDGTASGFSFNIAANKTTIGTAISQQYFKGSISSTQIYNRALTSSEVLQNYNAMKDRFAFIFTVDTTKTGVSTSTQFKLPLVSSGSVNFVVEWGDGTSDTITTFNQAQTTHTYSEGGVYEIKIRGLLKGWRFDNGGDRLKMGVIKNWGCLDISVDSSFYGCTNMTCIATDAPNISSTSLYRTFRECPNFNGPVGNWNISNVTDITGCFQYSPKFNQPLSNWNTSNVTSFYELFSGSIFDQPIGNWNTSKVTNIGQCFTSTPFNQDIGNWDVSKVTNMIYVFSYNNKFNQNIGSWNVQNVTNFYIMFAGATAFNNGGSPSIDNWRFKTSGGTVSMQAMFVGATSFNQPIGSWNVQNVDDMGNMFNGATSFNQPIGSWNVLGVSGTTNDGNSGMGNMFNGATSFNQNIGGWNVSNVRNFGNFMNGKTPSNFSSANLDSIYNNWSLLNVQPNLPFSVNFGTIKYTSAGAAGRATLINTYGWTIIDGGQV